MEEDAKKAISDLFFYMDHRKYYALMSTDKSSFSEMQEAIEEDAIRMQSWLKQLGHLVSYENLVMDFDQRLNTIVRSKGKTDFSKKIRKSN